MLFDAVNPPQGLGGGRVISMAQIPAGRMYMPARKFPVMSQASGVRNQ